MADPRTTAWAIIDIADDILAQAHAKLATFSVILVAGILLMWGINSQGYEEANWAFFFIGGWIVLIAMFAPHKVLAAMGIGIAIVGPGLTRENILKGSAVGLKGLYKLILGILLYFWMISGFLATWSFQDNPIAFIPFAGMLLLLLVLNSYYEKKSEALTIWLVTFYALIIIVSSLWSTQSDRVSRATGIGVTTPTVGTRSVTSENYIGHADGRSYTLTDSTWLVFDHPYDTCVQLYPATGIVKNPDRNNHIVRYLSRSGDIQREIRTLQADETWRGYTC
jgi:hypothetical protein